jgi:hypothetical protein
MPSGCRISARQRFSRKNFRRLREKKNVVVFANVFGYTRADYEQTIEILNQGEGIAAYEINVSCPNTAHGGIQFGSDPHVARRSGADGEARGSSADHRQTLAQRHLDRADGIRCRGSGRRRHLAGEYVSSDGD